MSKVEIFSKEFEHKIIYIQLNSVYDFIANVTGDVDFMEDGRGNA